MEKYTPHGITCKKENCFAYVKGVCSVLRNTNFGKRECPFFKLKEKNEKCQ